MFRVVRPVSQTPAKEIVKEFLRFIGCIVSDHPVLEARQVSGTATNVESTVDLLFSSGKLPPESIESGNRRSIVVQTGTEAFTEAGRNGMAVFALLMGDIINQVWTDGYDQNGEIPAAMQRAQLHAIKDIFFRENLFGFFQCKRSFRIVNMIEVYGQRFHFGEDQGRIDASEENPVTRSYILAMVNAFERTYHDLGVIETPCVYTRYARVNIARKIHEVCSQISGLEISTSIPGTKALLSELDSIYDMDRTYMSTLFLAAAVCKSSPALYMSSSNYYRALLDMVDGVKDEFYSFAYYEYGRHLERVYSDWENAIIAYRKAAELDGLNYQAKFKAGCYEAQYRGNYTAAENLFQNLRKELLLRYSGDPLGNYSNLSLKELQYLYKIDIWLMILNREMGRTISALEYRNWARYDAVQYWENHCVRRVYGSESREWQELQKYHETSVPVRVLMQQVGLNPYWQEDANFREIEVEDAQ